jgi:hypothetical protein
MKRLLFFATVLAFASSAFAQKTPEACLGLVPSLPNQCCSQKQAEKRAYLAGVDESIKQLDAEIQRRLKEANANAKQNQEKMTAGVMAQVGISPADVQKMKNMTPEERKAAGKAMADKMMQEKYNISLEEAEKLKTMSKEGREAWAKAYGTEAAANAQANPQQNQAAQDKAKTMQTQAQEVQALLAKFTAQGSKFRQQIDDLDKDPTAMAIMEKEIKPLEKKLEPYMGEVHGSAVAESERLEAALTAARLRYCQQLSPKFTAILSNHLAAIKASLPDYKRFEELQAESNKTMTGVDKPLAEPGLMGIQAIEGYVSSLKEIFKYDLNHPFK